MSIKEGRRHQGRSVSTRKAIHCLDDFEQSNNYLFYLLTLQGRS